MSSQIQDTFTHTPYGEMLTRSGTTDTAYQYTGQRFDDLTGLYQLRARYYDPGAGRPLSRDTWPLDTWSPVELNRYVYAAANPVQKLLAAVHSRP